MPRTHILIDLFAGAGGLSEGFAGFTDGDGKPVFRVGVSVEMDRSAHATLSLRSLYRHCLSRGPAGLRTFQKLTQDCVEAGCTSFAELGIAAYAAGFGGEWEEVTREALCATLGTEEGNGRLRARLDALRRNRREGLVLIGGPPCQAYSLVGRSRNRGIRGYRPENDKRHFLYEEYLSLLRDFEPDVFIMENVKGILSSSVAGVRMFERILEDLQRPAGIRGPVYDLFPLAPPSSRSATLGLWPEPDDFIVRSEDYGIPQARHRVIVAGVRRGAVPSSRLESARLVPSASPRNVGDVLGDIPALRSGLSRSEDTGPQWASSMEALQGKLVHTLHRSDRTLADFVHALSFDDTLPRVSGSYRADMRGPVVLSRFYRRGQHGLLMNHETRGHMPEDLGRYLFAASFAAVHGRSPSTADFPSSLVSAHRSWGAGHFADRFRVQMPNVPGYTITSHLSKDGHQFIHWDPGQCRSLTVREAARIQTFPDDYMFLGGRTQQYTQVGNAVPPLLARQVAAVVAGLLD